MTKRAPAAPKGTGPSGRRLWADVVTRYELDVHEELMLRQAVWTVDCIDRLQKLVERDGDMYDSTRTHPALAEIARHEAMYLRLVASLRLPDEVDERPQRRGGARGVYSAKRYGSMNVVSESA